MTHRFERLRDIVLAARELPREERAAYLDDACGADRGLRAEAESLLAHEASDDSLLNTGAVIPMEGGPARLADEADRALREPPPETIGPYRITDRIGEGGFGEVWGAEQEEPVRRSVAIKILKRGMDTGSVLARFEAERQALALMDHPNVARILDAGATPSGRPYFVMDRIDGVPITAYCDDARLGTQERVALFADVCDAIQHAHQKGVIHRDIKPSNILVMRSVEGDAVVKVIDFGISKAIHAPLTEKTIATMEGHVIGTPAYMSPEQASGGLDVDTTTDVYSLGTVLYELLAGFAPFDHQELVEAGLEGMPRILRTVDPATPSTRVSRLGAEAGVVATRRSVRPGQLAAELRGELDWITMTAMEKEPERRYASAAALADDLRRHLRNEPVQAAPPGAGYQARKFVRRHRLAVGAATAGVIVLAVFAVTMAVQAGRIAEERDRANRERDAAERVAGFLSEMLSNADPQELGDSLWEDLRERIRAVNADRGATPEEQDAILATVDDALVDVNPTDVALRLIDEEILERAGATLESELADAPHIAARLRSTFGKTYNELGLYEQADRYLLNAIAELTELHGEDAEPTLDAKNGRVALLQNMGRGEEAGELAEETLAAARASLGDEHRVTLSALTNYGVGLRQQGNLAEAETAYRECAGTYRRLYGLDHEATVVAVLNLGWLLHEAGQHVEGEATTREALAAAERVFGPDDGTTVAAASNLGTQLVQAGKLEEGEVYSRRALEGFRRAYGNEHPRTLIALVNLGALLDRQNKLEDAVEVYHESLAGFRKVLGEDHPNTVATMSNLGFALKTLGRYDEAEEIIGTVLEKSRVLFGEDHLQTLVAAGNLADLRILQGRAPEAEALLVPTIEAAERSLPEGHWNRGVLYRTYGVALREQGRYEEAETQLLRAHESLLGGLGAEHRRTVQAAGELVTLYEQWGRPESAAEWRAPESGPDG